MKNSHTKVINQFSFHNICPFYLFLRSFIRRGSKIKWATKPCGSDITHVCFVVAHIVALNGQRQRSRKAAALVAALETWAMMAGMVRPRIWNGLKDASTCTVALKVAPFNCSWSGVTGLKREARLLSLLHRARSLQIKKRPVRSDCPWGWSSLEQLHQLWVALEKRPETCTTEVVCGHKYSYALPQNRSKVWPPCAQ